MLELLHIAALNEEAVRIVSVWQKDMKGVHPMSAKAVRHQLRRRLATAVSVGIESNVDCPGTVT